MLILDHQNAKNIKRFKPSTYMKKLFGIFVISAIFATMVLTSCHKITGGSATGAIKKHRSYVEVKREELTNSLIETEAELKKLFENTSEENGNNLKSLENELRIIFKKIDQSTAENIDELKEKAQVIRKEISNKKNELIAVK